MLYSRTLLVAVCTALTLLLTACAPISSLTIGLGHPESAHSDQSDHHGPPAHAPAHGQRHKQRDHGRDLEFAFDSDLGVYVAIDLPNRYYWKGFYLQIVGDQWYESANPDHGWEPRSNVSLPPGLRHKHRKAKKRKHRPAKGHW